MSVERGHGVGVAAKSRWWYCSDCHPGGEIKSIGLVGVAPCAGCGATAKNLACSDQRPLGAPLTDDELFTLYDHEVVAREGETDGDALQRAHLEGLRRVSQCTRLELFREIEGIEARGFEGSSVLKHVAGIDQGACHARDREVAAHVAEALTTVLAAELDALAGCDGKVDVEAVKALLDRIAIAGARPARTEPATAAGARG